MRKNTGVFVNGIEVYSDVPAKDLLGGLFYPKSQKEANRLSDQDNVKYQRWVAQEKMNTRSPEEIHEGVRIRRRLRYVETAMMKFDDRFREIESERGIERGRVPCDDSKEDVCNYCGYGFGSDAV